MKSYLFLIGILVTALAVSNAIAMNAAIENGMETNTFTTDSQVYVTHPVSVVCNGVLESAELPVYITADKSWTDGESITGAIVNTTVTTNANGKLQTTMIWDSPAPGDYDIIIDLNKNGNYDSSDATCTDLLDDNALAGFTVINATVPAQNEEQNATINETVNETQENTTTNETQANTTVTEQHVNTTLNATQEVLPAKISTNATQTTTTTKTDYIPFIIIGASILIAGLIIAITLRRIH